jgi:hypothetical protein
VKTIVVVCGLVLFSWPIAVIVWRYLNRPKPRATTDPYRAGPPPAPPEPPWFVRWWDWANAPQPNLVPWLRRHGNKINWILGATTGVAVTIVMLTSVKFEKTETKAPAVATAKAEGKYPGWTCGGGTGYWVPEDVKDSENDRISVSCSAGQYGAQNCVACDTFSSRMRCWNLERCP